MHIQTETEMTDLTKLAPCEVWTEFEAITRVPRPSKKEEKIRDYLVGWLPPNDTNTNQQYCHP